jgi:hypothetical protein
MMEIAWGGRVQHGEPLPDITKKGVIAAIRGRRQQSQAEAPQQQDLWRRERLQPITNLSQLLLDRHKDAIKHHGGIGIVHGEPRFDHSGRLSYVWRLNVALPMSEPHTKLVVAGEWLMSSRDPVDVLSGKYPLQLWQRIDGRQQPIYLGAIGGPGQEAALAQYGIQNAPDLQLAIRTINDAVEIDRAGRME